MSTTTDDMEARLRLLRPTTSGVTTSRNADVSVELYARYKRCVRLLIEDAARPLRHKDKLSAQARGLLNRAAFALLMDAQELEPRFVRVRRS